MKQCYYVARLYSKLMPTIIEEFPFTSEGMDYVENDFTDALIDAICGETIEEDDNEDIR